MIHFFMKSLFLIGTCKGDSGGGALFFNATEKGTKTAVLIGTVHGSVSSCEGKHLLLKCFRVAATSTGWPLPTGHARGSERRRGKPDQSWQPARCGFKMTTPTPLISPGRG